MRIRVLATLSALTVLLSSVQPAVADPPAPIKLSEGVAAARKVLEKKPDSGRHVVLVDVETLGVDDTAALFASIEDLRRDGGVSIAVCPRTAAGIKAGAALVALACDAMVFVRSAELTGADSSWCTSASRRDSLSQSLARLARIDRLLAERFLDPTAALSWSDKSGLSADEAGSLKLATAGSPIQCGVRQFKRIGIDTSEFDSVDAALAAIGEGKVSARKESSRKANGKADSPKPPTGSPSGSAPSTPAGGVRGNGSGGSAGSPVTPAATPASADPKLNEKLREYAAALAALKASLKEFNEYYEGRRGVWTSEHRGLKWVWDAKSDHTRDGDTKVACQRLQRDIKTSMSTLESCMKTVERIVKDNGHPDLVRMKSNKTALDGLRAAIERNKVSNYETYYPQVLGLK